jgi:plastocyanin
LVATYNKLRSQGVALPDLERPPDPNQPFSELVALANTESDKAFSGLPGAFTDDDQIAQNVGQPCFLRTGGPPEDPATPCAKASQKQPEFDGRQSYFNSGIIPYEGAKGNTFSVKLADDIAPGTYLFYCAVHGFGQRTEIEVKPKGSAIPSEGAVSREARKEINQVAAPLKKVFHDAGDDGRISIPGPDGKEVQLEGPFAGLPGKDHAAITAFVPRKIKVKAGEPITWKMMAGDHTISFNVPKYFPIMEFLADGTVRINPKLQPPAGGAEPLPAQQGTGVVHHDGGTFDGSGFWSSGLIGAEPYLEYTMRITKPGTYGYACLLHPPMVGTVEVT